MFVSYVETFSAAILLILLAIFVLHLIQGDAMTWLTSKFTVKEGSIAGTSGGTTSTGGGGSGGAIA